MRSHRGDSLSHVPFIKNGTTGQAGTGVGTKAGQGTLKALALQRLERDKEWDKPGTRGGTNPARSVPRVPPSQAMPSTAEIHQICTRVTEAYPAVDPERLAEFLVVAEDPDWCSARAARQLARRMAEGLIR